MLWFNYWCWAVFCLAGARDRPGRGGQPGHGHGEGAHPLRVPGCHGASPCLLPVLGRLRLCPVGSGAQWAQRHCGADWGVLLLSSHFPWPGPGLCVGGLGDAQLPLHGEDLWDEESAPRGHLPAGHGLQAQVQVSQSSGAVHCWAYVVEQGCLRVSMCLLGC